MIKSALFGSALVLFASVFPGSSIGSVEAVDARTLKMSYVDNPQYYQCMDGCNNAWVDKNNDCLDIGARKGVSGWEYQICAWERDDALSACATQCDRSYPDEPYYPEDPS